MTKLFHKYDPNSINKPLRLNLSEFSPLQIVRLLRFMNYTRQQIGAVLRARPFVDAVRVDGVLMVFRGKK
jgi:hypothetical protein